MLNLSACLSRLSDSRGSTFPYNLRFPGQYYDSETGLNQNWNRDYDPLTGRYIESDPVGLAGGSYSTYSYAGDSPVADWDESGLAPGGPYHPPIGTKLKCTEDDTCMALKGKMWVLMAMIDSHQLWDWLNPPPRGGGRHAQEIADLWRAYAWCQALHKAKCENCPPNNDNRGTVPMPLPDWPPGVPTPTPVPPETVPVAPVRIPVEIAIVP